MMQQSDLGLHVVNTISPGRVFIDSLLEGGVMDPTYALSIRNSYDLRFAENLFKKIPGLMERVHSATLENDDDDDDDESVFLEQSVSLLRRLPNLDTLEWTPFLVRDSLNDLLSTSRRIKSLTIVLPFGSNYFSTWTRCLANSFIENLQVVVHIQDLEDQICEETQEALAGAIRQMPHLHSFSICHMKKYLGGGFGDDEDPEDAYDAEVEFFTELNGDIGTWSGEGEDEEFFEEDDEDGFHSDYLLPILKVLAKKHLREISFHEIWGLNPFYILRLPCTKLTIDYLNPRDVSEPAFLRALQKNRSLKELTLSFWCPNRSIRRRHASNLALAYLEDPGIGIDVLNIPNLPNVLQRQVYWKAGSRLHIRPEQASSA